MANGNVVQKRRFPRTEAVFRVDYRDVRNLVDYTENLSEEGVFIATEKRFEPGAQITFEISFPNLVKPIRLSGEVVWRRTPESLGELKPPGIGVCLRFDNDIERQWLRDLLCKLTGDIATQPAKKEDKEYVVLLAEDNDRSRLLFIDALSQSNGHPVRMEAIEATSEHQAWNLLETRRVDLLIIEWRLCANEEFDIMGRLRRNSKTENLAVLVLGSNVEEGQQALAAGADVFLRRPIPAKGLIRTVRSFFKQRMQEES